MSLQIFGGDHITIFVTVFAVGDSVINNECTLTVYVSQCSEVRAVHADVVSVNRINSFGKLIHQN